MVSARDSVARAETAGAQVRSGKQNLTRTARLYSEREILLIENALSVRGERNSKLSISVYNFLKKVWRV